MDKKRFLGLDNFNLNSEKVEEFTNLQVKKNKYKYKRKIVTFVGRLNKSKGYDLFGKAIIKI